MKKNQVRAEEGLPRLMVEIRRGSIGSLLSAFNFNILAHKYLKIMNKV